MRHRKTSDDFRDLTDGAANQQQREEKGEMVVATEDVLNAEMNVADQRCPAGVGLR